MSHRFVFQGRSGNLNRGTCPLTRTNKPWRLVFQLQSEPFNLHELTGDAKFQPLIERLFERGGWMSKDPPNSAGGAAGDYYTLGTCRLRKGDSFVGVHEEFQGIQLEAQLVATAAGVAEDFRVLWSQRCVFTAPEGGYERKGAELNQLFHTKWLSSDSGVYGTAGIFRSPFLLTPLRHIVNPNLVRVEAEARRAARDPFSPTHGEPFVAPPTPVPPFTPPGPNGQEPHRNGRWFFPLFVQQSIEFIGPSGRSDDQGHSGAQHGLRAGASSKPGTIARHSTPTWSQVAPALTEEGFREIVKEVRAVLKAKIARRLAAAGSPMVDADADTDADAGADAPPA